MKQTLLALIICLVVAVSCNSVKKTQKAINFGNYNEAIETALKQLRNDKLKKNNQPFVFMLKEAFDKAEEVDLNLISFLEKEGNPANFEKIYNTYANLNIRQEKIRPLLPLINLKNNKQIPFSFSNYDTKIIQSKEQLSNYLYQNSVNIVKNSNKKIELRKAYSDLNYLNGLKPNYKNVLELMSEAHFKGTDFIIVELKNSTNKFIPQKLQDDLLNIDTFKLNSFWTVYHSNEQTNVKHDYNLLIDFQDINVSPEQIKERIVVQEKQVKDGWKYLLDQKGNTIKDSLGNKIKVDNFKTIKSTFYENTQFKTAQVIGKISFIDLESNQLLESFPLRSEFIFENTYGTFRGDKNALEESHILLLNNRFIPFPSNEQMIYDTGEDLKQQLKSIIQNNKFK
ncbi:hypothetical protein [Lutibacter sp.]|uniref:hypothetical protein n=1 Tax=Lutibacter sp. TaxID=1925666 RepID=UPI002733914A|nr:hypothetical protein [Lutibacter sp.]MDP3313227.1 hypothetical protein [Lutibacter sp.]